MKIAVLRTGMVGDAIASKLVALGHDVMMGSREVSIPLRSLWPLW
jgi:predicted dinucleotide-binding enzyme